MPTAERLQRGGLTYNRFHTTALCAPTRAALLSGRNHHSVGMGMITETATSAPGSSGLRPNTKAALATTLKLNGYSTAQFGKCHEVPPWQTSPVGPFDAWPSGGGGFEYFYGFIGGENNQYYPALYEGTSPVEPEKTPEEGYHLTEDLTDHAIDWIRTQKALAPDKPFFVYFAPGATHAPHHVPLEWADKYAGQFAGGWDAQRESIFARQKAARAWCPPDAELTARPDAIPAWDDMDDALKPVLERQMEIYAGFLEHTDFHVGRLIDAIEEIGALDNTLVYYIIGDNGASAEGTRQRRVQRDGQLQRHGRDRDARVHGRRSRTSSARSDAYNHYAVGWAWAMCTPVPVDQAGRLALGRHPQRHDRALAGRDHQQGRDPVPVQPRHRRGTDDPRGGRPARADVRQRRPAGADRGHQHGLQLRRRRTRRSGTTCSTSRWPATAASTSRAGAPSPGTARPGCRTRCCRRSTTTSGSSTTATTDWTQAHDLAAEQPDRLAALQRLWLIEAVKYNVLPIDDRRFERLNATIAGRPQLITGTTQVLFPGMKRLSENSVIDIKNRSFTVTAAIDTAAAGPTNGVIIAQGGRFGGWALYVKDGRAKFVYNVLGMQEFVTEATEPLPAGKPPGPRRVRLRRRRSRQGRRRHPVLRRRAASAPAAST